MNNYYKNMSDEFNNAVDIISFDKSLLKYDDIKEWFLNIVSSIE